MRRAAAIGFAVLALSLACMAIFAIVGDSPADEPAPHLMVVFGIAAFYAGRASYRRLKRQEA